MKEHIKEIAREAGLLAHNPEGVPTKLEKFAELIVRECATLIPAEQSHTPNGQLLLKIFEEHFGVGE